MNKFIEWFNCNNLQIVWFLVGFFISQAFTEFAVGNWNGALLALAFAGANYYVNRQ